jgi:hypothetical protein
MTQAATDISIHTTRLTLSRIETQSFLKAVDCAKHALPGRAKEEAKRDLYAYHIDKAHTVGYITATDGHRMSKWAFHTHAGSPAFRGPVSVEDVEAYRKARHETVSLTLADGISYPDAWRAAWDVMRGAMRIGRLANITPLLQAVSAFESAGLESIMLWIQESDVHITAEGAGLKMRALLADVIEDGTEEAACCITPSYLADALRAIERGKPRVSEVIVDLSLWALRLTVTTGVTVAAEEVIMTREWNIR